MRAFYNNNIQFAITIHYFEITEKYAVFAAYLEGLPQGFAYGLRAAAAATRCRLLHPGYFTEYAGSVTFCPTTEFLFTNATKTFSGCGLKQRQLHACSIRCAAAHAGRQLLAGRGQLHQCQIILALNHIRMQRFEVITSPGAHCRFAARKCHHSLMAIVVVATGAAATGPSPAVSIAMPLPMAVAIEIGLISSSGEAHAALAIAASIPCAKEIAAYAHR